MSTPQPPQELVTYWCPACQRHLFTGRKPSHLPHLDGAAYCAGQWQRLVYTLTAPAPKEV